jgi:hypothetical protein
MVDTKIDKHKIIYAMRFEIIEPFFWMPFSRYFLASMLVALFREHLQQKMGELLFFGFR